MSKPKITLEQIQQRATNQSFVRGKEYHRGGMIYNTVRRGNDFEAYCEGSEYEPYRVQATLNDAGVISHVSCTCLYDLGGDCKHIVALLLTYLETPEVFTARSTIHVQLAKRSKDELIQLIEDMLDQHPALQDLIDRPTPQQVPLGKAVDTRAFRQQMQQARRHYSGWDDVAPVKTVYSIMKTGERFEEAQDWQNAIEIYRAIVEEATPTEEYFVPDDEGDFSMAVDDVLRKLVEMLEQADVVQDDAMRHVIFETLLQAYIWDMDAGGVGFADGITEDMLPYIRPQDIPAIRKQIETAKARKADKPYGEWGVQAYERFLMELDVLDNTDPETTLERLREAGQYHLLMLKLLDMQRHEEALAVLDKHITYDGDWFRILPHMVEAGLGEEARKRVENRLKTAYNDWLVNWLIGYYTQLDNQQVVFFWERVHFDHVVSVQSYIALQAAAEAVGQWEATRAEIIVKLEKEQRYDVLTHIYLHEKAWDKAWESVARVESVPRQYHWGFSHLEMEVAQKTQTTHPKKAIPVYIKQARRMIGQRQRKSYTEAAHYLEIVRGLYRQLDDEATWDKLIADLREEFKTLRALQDEMNKAGLE